MRRRREGNGWSRKDGAPSDAGPLLPLLACRRFYGHPDLLDWNGNLVEGASTFPDGPLPVFLIRHTGHHDHPGFTNRI